MISRRQAISAGAALPALAAPFAADAENRPAPPDLSFLKSSPLLHESRARYFMQQEGLDALIVSHPANVFYLSNHWPQSDRMGFTDTAIAILPRDARRPLALMMPVFLYYYTHSPEDGFRDRVIFPYGQPLNPTAVSDDPMKEPEAAPARRIRVSDPAMMSERERWREASLSRARPPSAGVSWALAKALKELGLERGTLGIDEPKIQALLVERGLTATTRPGEDTLRRIRMSKSPTEIRLMKLAAQQNMEAAIAAAHYAREAGSTRTLRAKFFGEAALRGNLGVFMVIDGSSSDVLDEPLRDGMAFMIDCVSTCRFYHGDFARTVFVGEPPRQLDQACKTIAIAWRDIQTQLKAGLRFTDVRRLGKESLKKQGMDLNVSFTPHSVGLFHTDHPQPSLISPRTVEGLVLEENMILSVDCPVLQAGFGGTAHLEDLMLIGKDGAEPIHDVPPEVIVV